MQKQLSRDEVKLLELYSENNTYEEIQLHINRFSNNDYSGKQLNYAMSELRKKLRHNTQFAMGYQHAVQSMGLGEGSIMEVHYQNKGINIGIVLATVFWLAFIAILYSLTL